MSHESRHSTIRRFAPFAAALAVAVMFGSPASAFTFQDGQGNTIPKFDLEEQSRQFRKPELDASAAKKGFDTGFGTLQFGVQQNKSPFATTSPFGSNFNRSDNADRRHYERLFAPDSMKSTYD